jgi:cyclic pyranopterin phosphate synthase
MWYLCLYAGVGIDLRRALRAGASEEEIRSLIAASWRARADRGAEQRLALQDRSPLLPTGALRADPHLEMHTRGG